MPKVISNTDELKFYFKLKKYFSNARDVYDILDNSIRMNNVSEKIHVEHDGKGGLKGEFVSKIDGEKDVAFSFNIDFISENFKGCQVIGKIHSAENNRMLDKDTHEVKIFDFLNLVSKELSEKDTLTFSFNGAKQMPFEDFNKPSNYAELNYASGFLSTIKGNENIRETSVRMDGWNEQSLYLGVLSEESYDKIFSPECNGLAMRVANQGDSLMSVISQDEMQETIKDIISSINQKYDSTVVKVEYGLRSKSPFIVNYERDGEQCNEKLYPTKIDGLFVSENEWGECEMKFVNGKQLAKLAETREGEKFKIKVIKSKQNVIQSEIPNGRSRTMSRT